MLSMSERMLEADHQVLHHMLSDSEWDFDGLVSETSRQVTTLYDVQRDIIQVNALSTRHEPILLQNN